MAVNNHNAGSVSVSQTPETKTAQANNRKTELSPELREFMHMLKSLETELAARQPTAR
jgi:hypothetical protein